MQNMLNLTWSPKTMDGRRLWKVPPEKFQFDSQTLGVDSRGLKQHVMLLPTDMVSVHCTCGMLANRCASAFDHFVC
jgi:hypothetical protein